MDLKTAMGIAGRVCDLLEPAVETSLVVGSVRRGAREVNDIEIAVIPKMKERGGILFPGTLVPATDAHIQTMPLGTPLTFDEKIRRNGQRHKRLVWGRQAIVVEIFIVLPPAEWGNIVAIRTGPAGFSKLLVTPRAKGGALPADLIQKDGALWSPEGRVRCPTEKDFFVALQVPYWPPADRTDESLSCYLANHHGGIVDARSFKKGE